MSITPEKDLIGKYTHEEVSDAIDKAWNDHVLTIRASWVSRINGSEDPNGVRQGAGFGVPRIGHQACEYSASTVTCVADHVDANGLLEVNYLTSGKEPYTAWFRGKDLVYVGEGW